MSAHNKASKTVSVSCPKNYDGDDHAQPTGNELRKLRTRRKLLDCAAAVFRRKGYHKALISDIVAEAGVGQGTFYRYYTDKREVFEALMDEFVENLLDEFTDMSANLPTDVEQYQNASISALDKVAETIDRNRDLALLFIREAPTIDEGFTKKIENLYNEFAELAQFYLRHAIKEGFARPCRTEIVSQALVGIGLRVADIWFSERIPGVTLKELTGELVDFAFRGFGPGNK